MKHTGIVLLTAAFITMWSCTGNDPYFSGEPPMWGDNIGGNGADDGTVPDFDTQILPYQGQTATDGALDQVGSDADIYWEANDFSNIVTIKYAGDVAEVETSCQEVITYTDGAHVTLDLLSLSATGVRINASGSSRNGSLKIYGAKKTMLNLDGLDLESKTGPAINNQCKKRLFVNLADGKVNKLTDNASYSDDAFYLSGNSPDDEDRKGCFFSEGNLIFSGSGSIVVAGKHKHGIASDGYMYVRPGTTIAVTEAAKNAIHIKGDKSDGTGIVVAGGLIYTHSAAAAGKGLKTDYNVEIKGGRLELNTTGEAIYDADENDTSSAAGIKADANVSISGGRVVIKSIGTGGKGVNVDGALNISGGDIMVVTTGGKFVYNAALDLDSSPKGIKADGDITIDGGTLNIMVSGVSDGSEGLESKGNLTINGGDIYVYAYDDAINAAESITFNGGRVYAYAVNNDGIDSNGTMTFNDGVVISNGGRAPEEGFDCDRSEYMTVNGGVVIGIGGAAIAPSSRSTQNTVVYNGMQFVKGVSLAVLDSAGKPVVVYSLPRSLSGSLFFSCPALKAGASYAVSVGGKLESAAEGWNGWWNGGTWSGGTQSGTFTINGSVTMVGDSVGPGGVGPR